MKITAKLLLAIIISVLYSGLAAQFPTNFEFLEHHHAKSTLGVQKLHNDAIYFCSHNNYKPQTLVSRITADGTFEVLLKPTYDAFSSKLFIESDSSFQLVLYNLIDYDVPMGGIFVVNVKGSEYSIDTIVDYNLFPTFDSFYNIEKDENGDWITFADQIYRFDKNGIISSEPLSINSYNSELIANQNKDLFLIENYSTNKWRLSKYENGSLSLLYNYDDSNHASQLLSCEKGNYLSIGGQLLHYNDDFSTLLNSWDNSTFEGQLVSAVYENGQLEVMTTSEEHYYLYSISSDNEMELIFQAENNAGEKMAQFTILPQDQYLFTGSYSIEDISRNIFFRNTNIIDNSNVVYPKSDIALDKLEITLAKKDTYDIIVSTPDTFYGISYFYDITAFVTNESDEDIYIANAISDDYNFYPYHINLEIDSLAANSSDTRQTSTYTFSSRDFDNIKVALPGGNYRFNKNENKVVIARTSSTLNLEKIKLLTVYPNPVSDLLKLNSNNSLGSITIYDERGQMVYYTSENINEVNVSNLKPGNYIISIKSLDSNQKRLGKFIKI